MTENEYPGIDVFRLAASLSVIAIHTSPLTSFSRTGDFLLTRSAARIAVPFFFMASGFFLITRYACNVYRLVNYIKKTAVIYFLSTLFYLPLNIYGGYFQEDPLLPKLLRDILLDGTFYHLWYLPASMAGASIAWYLVRRHGWRRAFIASFTLYLIGLFGDSYYGLTARLPVVRGFYALIFQVCDQTRNGVFFAPLFFVMGGFLAQQREKKTVSKNLCCFFCCYLMLLGEAFILHRFTLQRRDSMYLSLIPCMYFGFRAILHIRGKRMKILRDISLAIYLLHPLMIIAVRDLVKFAPQLYCLTENSFLRFLAVTLLSVGFGILFAFLKKIRLKKILYPSVVTPKGIRAHKQYPADTERAFIEINLSHLEHNVKTLQAAMQPGCKLMAVVKANAYGHGAFAVATHLDKIGVDAFAVATVDEGIRLRKYGVSGEILILGYTDVRRAPELKRYGLMQTLIGFDYAKALNAQNLRLKTHLKIDTGMHRLGIDSRNLSEIEEIFTMKNLEICGIYTHLCCTDSLQPADVAFTKGQISRFYRLIDTLKAAGTAVPKIHLQSSYGLINYPGPACDYVRAGIALYGVPSAPEAETATESPEPGSPARELPTDGSNPSDHAKCITNSNLWSSLRPVLSLKSRIVLIRSVPKGDSIGYSRTFTTSRNSRIAVLSIGYADGLPRSLSETGGLVMIRGQLAPIVGRICMDQMTVDVTDLDNVQVGDLAELINTDLGGGLTAPLTAVRTDSISNELLSRLGARLPVRTCV